MRAHRLHHSSIHAPVADRPSAARAEARRTPQRAAPGGDGFDSRRARAVVLSAVQEQLAVVVNQVLQELAQQLLAQANGVAPKAPASAAPAPAAPASVAAPVAPSTPASVPAPAVAPSRTAPPAGTPTVDQAWAAISKLTQQEQYAVLVDGLCQIPGWLTEGTYANDLLKKFYAAYAPNEPKPASGWGTTFARWMNDHSDMSNEGRAIYDPASGLLREPDGRYSRFDPANFIPPAEGERLRTLAVMNSGQTWEQRLASLERYTGLTLR
jgi:hypothetical protein